MNRPTTEVICFMALFFLTGVDWRMGPRIHPLPVFAAASTSGSGLDVAVSHVYNSSSCKTPCRNGTFETMPCIDTRPKLCRECSKTCPTEQFISDLCEPLRNTQCKPCRSRCGRVDYEFTPCVGIHDRQCKDIDTIPKPTFSSNLISENRRDVKQVVSYAIQQDSNTAGITSQTVPLKRGTGFTVQVTIREANLAPLYTAVDHSRSNDNEDFRGDSRITQEYCPYPVPEKYQLSLVQHQGVTTKAQFYSCDKEKRSKGKCEAETGFYVNPKEPCETYTAFGRLPSLDATGHAVVCIKPGKLTDAFGVSAQITEVTSLFVDKTVKCAEQRTACDTCSVLCARNMQNQRGSHRCNITADDADNGQSPRLQYCFSCCSKQECSKLCEVYHIAECQQIRCITGNLVEFILNPVFSNRETIFACHVHPVPKYTIYDIDYTVLHHGNPINDQRLRATRVYEKHHQPKSVDAHNFLKVHYGSEIWIRPDLIEGDSSLKTFSAGHYQAKGQPLVGSEVTSRTLSVRPKAPFGVSSGAWKRQNCDTDLLSEFVWAVGTQPDTDPYRREPLLEVQLLSPHTYRLFNKTHQRLPFIYFEIPQDQSILRPMYNPTTVSDDRSLKAELIRKETSWVLTINGQIHKCPGSFEIVVRDPLYPLQPLFDFDVGVNCPNTFAVEFVVPTEGTDDYDKTLLVHISDSYRVIKITVFRPAPNITKETNTQSSVSYENMGEISMNMLSPYVAVLCVAIAFNVLLLFVGFLTEPGREYVRDSSEKVPSQRLLFVVCYATFRATYSIAVTFTLLMLLTKHVNRDGLGTLSEFPQFVETLQSNQRQEMEKIHAFVASEIQRQNKQSNKTKSLCEEKLGELQNKLEESKQQMRVQSHKDRLVSQVALQYTSLMILNLTESVNKFKQDFSNYATKAMDRLMKLMVQTSSAIQSNKWLAGAKIIYDAVKSKRTAQGQETKTFMKWVGIEQEVDRLVADLSLKDFPLPNLTDFLHVEIPKTADHHQSSIPRLQDAVLPRNQWYYQYDKKAPPPEDALSRSRPSKEVTVTPSDVISWVTFLATLFVIDLVWFVHRMARTYSTAKLILYGCPTYTKIIKPPTTRQSIEQKTSASSRCLLFLKKLNLRVMKTDFVPKLVAALTTCCAVYIFLVISDRFLSIKALASIGYFDALVAPVEACYQLARTRIKTNAHRINKFEFPFYEDLVNIRTKRYQIMIEMYAELHRTGNLLRDSEYCAWKKLLSPDEACRCTSAQVVNLKFDGCELPPVTYYLTQRHDFGVYREQISRSIIPYVNAARQVVMDTSHLVGIFVAVLVLVDSLGAVLWMYLQRFGLVRIKCLLDISQPAAGLNHNREN